MPPPPTSHGPRPAGSPIWRRAAKVAFYFWHDGDAVHLYTSGTSKVGHKDWGTIVLTGGKISGVHRVNLKASDLTELKGTTEVIFHFETTKGLNQVYFYISGGTKIKITGTYDGGALSNLILYGKNATPSKANPVTFDLTK